MKSRQDFGPESYRHTYVPNAREALRALGRGLMPAVSRTPVKLDRPLTESAREYLYGRSSDDGRSMRALLLADLAMSDENAMRQTLGPNVAITSDKPGYHHEAVVVNEPVGRDIVTDDSIDAAPAAPVAGDVNVSDTFVPRIRARYVEPGYAVPQRPGGVPPHQQ